MKASAEAKAAFQEALSRLGDVFVFEAFGAAHRPHSSISGIKIPIRVAGLLMKKELEIFSQVLDKPKKVPAQRLPAPLLTLRSLPAAPVGHSGRRQDQRQVSVGSPPSKHTHSSL